MRSSGMKVFRFCPSLIVHFRNFNFFVSDVTLTQVSLLNITLAEPQCFFFLLGGGGYESMYHSLKRSENIAKIVNLFFGRLASVCRSLM